MIRTKLLIYDFSEPNPFFTCSYITRYIEEDLLEIISDVVNPESTKGTAVVKTMELINYHKKKTASKIHQTSYVPLFHNFIILKLLHFHLDEELWQAHTRHDYKNRNNSSVEFVLLRLLELWTSWILQAD